MAKDVRGIERGKSACGECEDFMRSDGATCGYCGCFPTRHSKKDARYSSDSVFGTSAAGISESASPENEESSPETDFIPEPRAETSKYGRKRTRVKRDNYVSWEKIVF
ncbi:unnamed protein product [Porites lobata]|uniref:Uncharacterized protein n=1 Tax=Porites lobata TaxID=104759 RepID=A0ABN8PR19_9CNID|nr:unnamed protein product [Porites lobata]